ncbi:MAG: class II aldolase/adducin family protein [Chloroflexi bacterium]|nr:class II aldolase/adducin family protein [Chloroflexota bacterium]
MKWEAQRRQVLETAREMLRLGLVAGSSGNVSLQLPEEGGKGLLAITPSQKPYVELQPQDIVVIDHEAEPVEGELVPSSESLLHIAVYRARADVGAVIHTHPVFASVLAVAGLELPPILDELVLAVGGPVQLAQYAFPGTQGLAEAAQQALGERNAVLLRNHGLLTVGRTASQALDVAVLVERASEVFLYARLLGAVNKLPDEVVSIEQELFRMRRSSEGLASSQGSRERAPW